MECTAETTLPDEPPNAVTCGVDWARDDHAVSIVDARGREVRRATIEHNAAGLRELLELLSRAGAREVAIEPTGDNGAANAHLTRALVAALTSVAAQIKALDSQIAEQLTLHADAHIFTSLPRSGTVRAARLLAEIGDCRARFPTPESLACLPGVAPCTRQSGKVTHVGFRWAADNNSATPSATSPATAAEPTFGPPTCTTAPSPEDTTTPTPYASWPAPGSTSSGTAGKTAPPTTPPDTEPSKPSSTKTNKPRPTNGGLTQGYS
jgi:transposase